MPLNKMIELTKKALLAVLYICCIPFLFLLLLFDFKHLRKVAEEIEPPEEVVYEPRNTADAALGVVLRYVVRPIVILLGLPCIVIWGGLLLIFGGNDNNENDEVTW